MEFANERFDEMCDITVDVFICTISYEERSSYLFDRLATSLRPDNTLILATDNYKKFINAREKIEKFFDLKYHPQIFPYQDYESALSCIRNFLMQKMKEKDSISVYVDYSSMPRGWYCRLPGLFEELLRSSDHSYFWYAEGIYKGSYHNYPTAGIDAFLPLSGRPSLSARQRVHIIGLGYDSVRTQGIVSIIDPEYMILFECHDSGRREIYENVMDANRRLLSQASMSVSLELTDFIFMISKLCETAYEYAGQAEVIFVPDGPKPLILAMSLIPNLIKLPGVACLHVTRNYEQFVPIEVTASGKIVGFSISFNNTENDHSETELSSEREIIL